jgi:hypothetical protein
MLRLSTQVERCTSPVSIPTYQALYSLYNSTHGSDWTWEEESEINGYKWNFTDIISDAEGAGRPCAESWQGIDCDFDVPEVNTCYIYALNLQNHNLVGSLPPNIGYINGLRTPIVSVNFMTGTVPTTLGHLDYLQHLILMENGFVGSFPSELSKLTTLISIEISSNQFTGPILSELFSSGTLEVISLSSNHFTGGMPAYLGNASSLTQLFFDFNTFTGPVPYMLGSPNATFAASLAHNYFTGSLPTGIGYLSNFIELILQQNYLSSSIPSELGLLSLIRTLSLGENHFTSFLPTELGNLGKMGDLEVYSNRLSGTIPSELGSDYLTGFSVGENLLTGTIPPHLLTLTSLTDFYINNNYFTGMPITTTTDCNVLIAFVVNNNLFTSTFPTALKNLTLLEQVALSSNYFTGQLPLKLAFRMFLLQVSDNYFTGPLSTFAGTSLSRDYPFLSTLDVSDNGFTGSFPSTLFTLRRLTSLAAASNCFHGRLECAADSSTEANYTELSPLRIIDLNGLSSGVGCRNYIVSRTFLPRSGYYPTFFMEGSIPSCIWHFRNLTVLYMVGNGFTGSIYDESQPHPSLPYLVNLSLASNGLTGTVPEFIWSHEGFELLDLSSNRLHGSVSATNNLDMCSTDKLIDLSVNRFSGNLPGTSACSWSNLSTNILLGNMFTFSMNHMNAATRSSALSFYGSVTLDVAMVVSSPVNLVALCFLLAYVLNTKPVLFVGGQPLLRIWDEKWKSMLLPLKWVFFLKELLRCGKVFGAVVATVITTFVALYSVLKSVPYFSFATYLNQYSWIVSVAYLHGLAPAVASACVIICGLVVTTAWTVLPLFPTALDSRYQKKAGIVAAKVNTKLAGVEASAVVSKILVIFIINVLVVGSVNTGYLVEVLNNNPRIQLIQMALSVFKLTWNSFFIARSLQWLRGSTTDSFWFSPVVFGYVVKLVNFVVLPCFVTSLVADSCFLKLFQQQPAQQTYSIICNGQHTAENGTISCPQAIVSYLQDVPLTPPFIYSFQCSSAVITNYVPVLLYSFFISGVLVPSFSLTMLLCSVGVVCRERDDIDHISSFFEYGTNYLPVVFRPQTRPKVTATVDSGNGAACGGVERCRAESRSGRIFPCEAIVATLLLNATLLGTFGLIFPYLGVTIVCGTMLEVWMWLVAVGRYVTVGESISEGTVANGKAVIVGSLEQVRSSVVSHQFECNQLSVPIEHLVQTLEAVRPPSRNDLAIIILVIFVFWAAIFFDMVGDVYGTGSGLTAMFSMMFCGPFVIFCSVFIFRYFSNWEVKKWDVLTSPQDPLAQNLIDDRFSLTSVSNPVVHSTSPNSVFGNHL